MEQVRGPGVAVLVSRGLLCVELRNTNNTLTNAGGWQAAYETPNTRSSLKKWRPPGRCSPKRAGGNFKGIRQKSSKILQCRQSVNFQRLPRALVSRRHSSSDQGGGKRRRGNVGRRCWGGILEVHAEPVRRGLESCWGTEAALRGGGNPGRAGHESREEAGCPVRRPPSNDSRVRQHAFSLPTIALFDLIQIKGGQCIAV